MELGRARLESMIKRKRGDANGVNQTIRIGIRDWRLCSNQKRVDRADKKVQDYKQELSLARLEKKLSGRK